MGLSANFDQTGAKEHRSYGQARAKCIFHEQQNCFMSKILALTFLALALLSPSHAMAESHDNSPFACVSPDRPGDDQNEVLWQRFLVEVEAFRECVDLDLQRHQLAAADHQARARLAVEAWQAFVTNSLNAPEDFPFQPDR